MFALCLFKIEKFPFAVFDEFLIMAKWLLVVVASGQIAMFHCEVQYVEKVFVSLCVYRLNPVR